MDKMEGERRTHRGQKKEEKQNPEKELGCKNVNVSQDEKDTPINFNQKREKTEGGNEAYNKHISENNTGKQKCESHGKAIQEKQVEDCRGTKHSQLSNGATEKKNKETREGNPKRYKRKEVETPKRGGTSVFRTVVFLHQ